MKLRTAKKIMANVVAGRCSYSEEQIASAVRRYERSESAKRADAYWNATMKLLGVSGRADILAGSGAPGMAFDLLMRSPEEEWSDDERI